MLIMPKRIPEATQQRGIRLVLDHLDEYPILTAACENLSKRLGFGAESLRRWVRQAQVDAGGRQGQSTSESERVCRLEWENRESREANVILRTQPETCRPMSSKPRTTPASERLTTRC